MRRSWFTFGQTHAHVFNGVTLDRDIVLEITTEDPRAVMASFFGDKWSMEYDEQPDMRWFPRGVMRIDKHGGAT